MQKAQEYGYDQSMMARFYKLLEEKVEQNILSRLPIVQLTVQYRMHPDICLFPSNYIYGRNLKTNRWVSCPERQAWLSHCVLEACHKGLGHLKGVAGGRSDSAAGWALALHMAYLGSSPDLPQ